MLYSLGVKVNTHSIVNFDYKSSSDHMDFQNGKPLRAEDVFLIYEVENTKALEKIKKMHFIVSGGPSLASTVLRDSLQEEESSGEVQFFDVKIFCNGEQVNGFYAINPLNKLESIDLVKSEYRVSNFDPKNPDYYFYYKCFREEFGLDVDGIECNANIATCAEMPLLTMVNDKILAKLKSKKIKGLQLCSALDLTPKDRSIYINL